MHLAIVASAHGYGHATRDVALADALAGRGHRVTLFTATPAQVLGHQYPLVTWRADVGLVQPDSLREDLDATRTALESCGSNAAIDALAAALSPFDGVIADIAPTALEAARRAGVPAVAMGNFDWAWIYRHYPALSDYAERFAAWQAPHPAVQLRPGPDLLGFRRVSEGGLLARRCAPRRAPVPARRHVLVGFGGFGLEHLDVLLPQLPDVAWIFAPPMGRPPRADCHFIGDIPYSALLAGADAVLTKPGYGMVAEAAVAGVPLLWFDRGKFPEAPILESAMYARGDRKVPAVPGIDSNEQVRAALAAALHAIWLQPRPVARQQDDREAIADAVLASLG